VTALAFAKPVPRVRQPKGLRRKTPLRAKRPIDRAPYNQARRDLLKSLQSLKRSGPPKRKKRMVAKPPRRLERDRAFEPYSDMLHEPETPCAGVGAFLGHVCEGEKQQAHLRDMTGTSRKEPANQTITLCAGLHDEYDGRKPGRFDHLSKAEKKEWFRKQIAIFHAMASARGIHC
jgi:hypothetical protein